jgi:hypothetical protein
MSFMLFLQYQGPLRMNELLIVIHFGFKDHGHLLMSFFSRKKLLFVGGSLAAGSRQQAAGSRQQAGRRFRISVIKADVVITAINTWRRKTWIFTKL